MTGSTFNSFLEFDHLDAALLQTRTVYGDLDALEFSLDFDRASIAALNAFADSLRDGTDGLEAEELGNLYGGDLIEWPLPVAAGIEEAHNQADDLDAISAKKSNKQMLQRGPGNDRTLPAVLGAGTNQGFIYHGPRIAEFY
jgi:hypothetical protein